MTRATGRRMDETPEERDIWAFDLNDTTIICINDLTVEEWKRGKGDKWTNYIIQDIHSRYWTVPPAFGSHLKFEVDWRKNRPPEGLYFTRIKKVYSSVGPQLVLREVNPKKVTPLEMIKIKVAAKGRPIKMRGL